MSLRFLSFSIEAVKIDFRAVASGLVAVFLGTLAIWHYKARHQVKGESLGCWQKVLIKENGHYEERLSVAKNLEEFFAEQGIKIYPEDRVSFLLPLSLCQGAIVSIARAPHFELIVGGKKQIVRSWKKTVRELLKEKKITLGAKDKVLPSLNALLKDGMRIEVIRVGERMEKEEIVLPFEVIYRPDANLFKGEKRVLQEGRKGKKVIVWRVISENGKDVRREKISERIEQAPLDRIVVYGTKPRTVYLGVGQAKWYLRSGEFLGACNLVPKGTRLLVTNLDNGRSIEVVASGWGAFAFPVIIDLSTSAFEALGGELWQGVLPRVKVEKIIE